MIFDLDSGVGTELIDFFRNRLTNFNPETVKIIVVDSMRQPVDNNEFKSKKFHMDDDDTERVRN